MTTDLRNALAALAAMTHPSVEKLLRRERYTFEADVIALLVTAWHAEIKTPQCNRTSLMHGGRTERECLEPAEMVCIRCGRARCSEHNDIEFSETDDGIICEECA